MKVYVIKGKKIGGLSDWFIYNIYSSFDKAVKVYTKLASDDYIYFLSEYEVID